MLPFAWLGLNLSPMAARAVALGVYGLVLLACLASALMAFRGALDDARQSGAAARDAHWRAQIAESNATVAAARLAQATAVAGLQADLVAARAATATTLEQLETLNARLPDGDRCGLDAERVRRLPR